MEPARPLALPRIGDAPEPNIVMDSTSRPNPTPTFDPVGSEHRPPVLDDHVKGNHDRLFAAALEIVGLAGLGVGGRDWRGAWRAAVNAIVLLGNNEVAGLEQEINRLFEIKARGMADELACSQELSKDCVSVFHYKRIIKESREWILNRLAVAEQDPLTPLATRRWVSFARRGVVVADDPQRNGELVRDIDALQLLEREGRLPTPLVLEGRGPSSPPPTWPWESDADPVTDQARAIRPTAPPVPTDAPVPRDERPVALRLDLSSRVVTVEGRDLKPFAAGATWDRLVVLARRRRDEPGVKGGFCPRLAGRRAKDRGEESVRAMLRAALADRLEGAGLGRDLLDRILSKGESWGIRLLAVPELPRE